MLKNISNLGTTLNKSEQQSINGGINPSDDCILPTPPCGNGYYKNKDCICVPGGPF